MVQVVVETKQPSRFKDVEREPLCELTDAGGGGGCNYDLGLIGVATRYQSHSFKPHGRSGPRFSGQERYSLAWVRHLSGTRGPVS